MIGAIDLKRLKNAEYLQFVTDFVTIIEDNDPEKLKVKTYFDAVSQEKDKLELLFKKEKSNKLTSEIIDIDKRRDGAIIGLYKLGNAYSTHYKKELANAGADLYHSIKLYGDSIHTQNYQMQTANINNIINDWETKPELINAITILGVSQWKEELKTQNNLFNEKYIERTKQYGAENKETLKNRRDQYTQVYYDIRDQLNARYTIENTEDYRTVISQINALISQYNSLIKSKKQNQLEEDTDIDKSVL